MAEYIDRDAVLEILCGKGAAWDAYSKVQSIPAADVRPVVRGSWTCHRTLEHDGDWWCTACGNELTIYMGNRPDKYKYCPNCGADMRENET